MINNIAEKQLAKNYFSFQDKIKNKLEKLLMDKKIKNKIESRIKSIGSIQQKIVNKNILFAQVLDVIGFRIIVKKEIECYQVMESILDHWSAVNSKIKDYIAVPKSNGYQGIHLTIMLDQFPVEFQIRTYKMHLEAEYGKAAHKKYKDNSEKVIIGTQYRLEILKEQITE